MPEFYFPRKAENATQLCGSDPDIRASFGDCNGLYRNDTLKPGFAYDVSLDGRSSSRAVSRILNRPSPQQRTYLAECTAQFGQDTVTLAPSRSPTAYPASPRTNGKSQSEWRPVTGRSRRQTCQERTSETTRRRKPWE